MLPSKVINYLYEEYFSDWKVPEHGILHLAQKYRQGVITIEDMREALDYYNSHDLGRNHDFVTLGIEER